MLFGFCRLSNEKSPPIRYFGFMKKVFLLVVLGSSVLWLLSCGNDNEEAEPEPVRLAMQEYVFTCHTFPDSQYVITTQTAFERMFQAAQAGNSETCQNFTPPPITFQDVVVLGKRTQVAACNVNYERYAFLADSGLVYRIEIRPSGQCVTPFSDMNFAAIALPEGAAPDSIYFDVRIVEGLE